MKIEIQKGPAPAPAAVQVQPKSSFGNDLIEAANEVAKDGGHFSITVEEFRATKRADGSLRIRADVNDLARYVRSSLTRRKITGPTVYIAKDDPESVIVMSEKPSGKAK